MNFIDDIEKWIQLLWHLTIVLIFAIIIAMLIFLIAGINKKRILFKAWINRFDDKDKELGKSIGDLLLFNFQTIKNIHDKSTKVLSVWNPYEDIPSIKQGLEQDVELIASVELGNYGKIINIIASFLLKIIPFIIKPATLLGSVNKYGDKKTLFMVTLDNYRFSNKSFLRKKTKKNTFVWKIEKEGLHKEQIPDLIEQAAYQIYIDLTGNDLFKSWDCFRLYTLGLQKYINFIDLGRNTDYEDAIKFYDKALALESNNAVICYNKGVMKYYKYEEAENLEAEMLFKKALNSSDLQLQVRARTGLCNAILQKYHRFNKSDMRLLEEAISHGEEACRLSVKLDSVHKCLGFAYHQKSEALAKKVPDSNEVYHLRSKAITHYNKAVKLNKQHYIAHNNLGNLYLEWSKYEPEEQNNLLRKAVKEFKRSLSINPRYHHAYDNLGNSYLLLKKWEEAREAYMNALLYQPNYPEAKNDLAVLFLQPEYENRNPGSAQKWHEEAVEAASGSQKQKLITQYEEAKNVFLPDMVEESL